MSPEQAPKIIRHKNKTIRARNLRKNQTDAETVFWHAVKAKRLNGFKFRRQVPIGFFYADFVCEELKVIVEIDGGQHCESAGDERRTAYLKTQGYEVVRFWNNDVMDNLDGLLSSLSLALSRKRERGQKVLP